MDVVLAIEHVLIQIATIAKLHDNVEVALTRNLDLLVVDQVGMDGQLLQDLHFRLVHPAGFLLRQRDHLADQFFLQIVQVVGLDDGCRSTSPADVVLDGEGGAFESFDFDLFAHIMMGGMYKMQGVSYGQS